MRILPKLITALRGAASETGEAIVDSQQLRILDQEMRQADNDLKGARENLTQVMAERRSVERKIEELDTQIKEYTGYGRNSPQQGRRRAGGVGVREDCRTRGRTGGAARRSCANGLWTRSDAPLHQGN